MAGTTFGRPQLDSGSCGGAIDEGRSRGMLRY